MHMLFIIFVSISSILAGMGIGGGALFIILVTNINNIPQKEAQALNLILFLAVSISATGLNIKQKNINFKIIKKTILFLILGSLIGTEIAKNIDEQKLKCFFSIFMLIIGVYEIISSLISSKKGNTNINLHRKGE